MHWQTLQILLHTGTLASMMLWMCLTMKRQNLLQEQIKRVNTEIDLIHRTIHEVSAKKRISK